MQAPGDTRLDTELVDGPPSGGLDAAAMRSRLAARLFGEEAGDVSIGRFEVVESVGVGGMGVVYLATDPKLGRRVALKLLHPTAVGNEVERLRLLREAQALAKLSHPNVVQLYEVGEHEGSIFLAMEYVEGVSLRQWQAVQRRTWRQTLTQYIQAGEGLAAAHAAGLVHRDFKPANVIVGNDGRVRVADFGLARGPGLTSHSSAEQDDAGASEKSPADSTITRPGAVIGTPAYMSPEQLHGEAVDARSDQFSFCVALWEALHGQRPYTREQLRAGSDAVAPKRGPRREVPRWVDRVLRRGLALRAGDRYAAMRELVAVLRRELQLKRTTPVLLFVVAIAATAGVTYTSATNDACPEAEDFDATTWNEAIAAEVAAGVSSVGEYAAAAWPPLHDVLGEYGRAWTDAARSLCRDAPSGGLRTPSSRCLQRGRYQFEHLTRLLRDSQADAVADAHVVAADFVDPQECLLAADPSRQVASVEAVRALDEATTAFALGRDHQVASLLSSPTVAEGVRASRCFAAKVHLRAAQAQRELGRPTEARSRFDDALTAATACASTQVAAEVLREAALSEARDFEEDEAAARLMRMSDAALEAEVPSRAERVRQLLARARLHRYAGDDIQALRLAKAASEASRGLSPRSATTRALALRELGNALSRADEPEAAKSAYEEARVFHDAAFGPRHPELARLELDVALMHRRVGDYTSAVPHFQSAIDLIESAHGSVSARLSAPLTGLAEAFAATGELERAIDTARRAWAIQSVSLPVGHVERGGALSVLAQLERATGSSGLYVEHMKLLAAEWEQGENRHKLPLTLNNIGYELLALGRPEEAGFYYSRLARLSEPGTLLGLYARLGLARSAWHQLDAEERHRELKEIEAAAKAMPEEVDVGPLLDEIASLRPD